MATDIENCSTEELYIPEMEDEECPICYNELTAYDRVKIYCNHTYHYKCIATWLYDCAAMERYACNRSDKEES